MWHGQIVLSPKNKDHTLSQTQLPTDLTLAPSGVGTPGGTEVTFVSDISSDVSLGSEIIKANMTFCSATELVISLATTTSVVALAVDAIIKTGADQLFDTEANMLSSRIRVLHRGAEMSMNGLVHTYMSGSERKRQVANDISINFTDKIQTTLTITQLRSLKGNVGTAHPIRYILHPITALGLTGFFRYGHKPKDFGFPALFCEDRKGRAQQGSGANLDACLEDKSGG